VETSNTSFLSANLSERTPTSPGMICASGWDIYKILAALTERNSKSATMYQQAQLFRFYVSATTEGEGRAYWTLQAMIYLLTAKC
jgi:hypothetical protein